MNPNKQYYGDRRLDYFCAFCGGPADTEDHVPSRCFLDKPYPPNLPVIPCCHKCNHDFSIDEEYVSCFIDCAKSKTANPSQIQRDKTRETLLHSPKLQERIAAQIRNFGGYNLLDYEKDRFMNVVRKLAYGHLAFENDHLTWGSKLRFSMWLVPEMRESQRTIFFKPYTGDLLPEVNSHGLEHILLPDNADIVMQFATPWVIVQEGRYAYCVSPDSNKVKFVIAGYLAVEASISQPFHC